MTTSPGTRPPTAKMTGPEFIALREYLLSQGMTPAQVGQAIGAAASNRSREQIAQALRIHLRQLPKAAHPQGK